MTPITSEHQPHNDDLSTDHATSGAQDSTQLRKSINFTTLLYEALQKTSTGAHLDTGRLPFGNYQVLSSPETRPEHDAGSNGNKKTQEWSDAEEGASPGWGLEDQDSWSTGGELQTEESVSTNPVAAANDPISCVVCLKSGDVGESVVLSCERAWMWCRDCLNTCFECASRFRPTFPPRCSCHAEIELVSVQQYLEVEKLVRFQEVEKEFRAQRPAYCCKPDCGRFLADAAADSTDGLAMLVTCEMCATDTCIKCRELPVDHIKSGEFLSCPDRIELAGLRQIVDEEGIRPRPGCMIMVERLEGCHNM